MSETNPWARANMHQYTDEVFDLIPVTLKPDYVRIMSNLLIHATELDRARETYQRDMDERDEFFRKLT